MAHMHGSSRFRLILAFLLVMLPCVPALAGGQLNPGGGLNSWDLYAFGNGQVIANALSSISAMMAMSGYSSLIGLMGMLSAVTLGVMAGFDPGKHALRFLTYVIVAFIVVYSMTGIGGSGGLTASVNVTDMITNQTYNVNNIPAAVAVPAAIVSDVGEWLTQTMEQNFSYGSTSLAISNGGTFNMAASMMSDLTKIQIGSPGIAYSINNYMQDCVVPALANGAIYPGDLTSSVSIWATLAAAQNNALMTSYIADSSGSSAQVVTCATAYTNISNDLTAYIPNLLSQAAGAWDNTPVGSLLAQETTDTIAWLSNGNITNGGATSIEQAAVLNQMSNSFASMATSTNNNAMVTALALAQAKQTQLSSWVSGAQVFQQMMGYIYAVLQVFIFGITPIIIVALLIPGLGAGILKNFGQVLIWLALWNPMFAVVSFIMNSYAQTGPGSLLQITSGGTATWGIAADNIGALSATSSTMVAAGGFLGTMVPLIAWGLVKGQMAFTEFVTHGIGSSFANAAATEMATGNVSLGNQSIDDQNFNKHNYGSQSSVGFSATQVAEGLGAADISRNAGGTSMKVAGTSVNPTQSTANSEAMTAAIKQSTSDSEGITQATGIANQQALSLANTLDQVVATGRSSGAGTSSGASAADTGTATSGTGIENKVSTSHAHQTQTQLAELAKLSAGLKAGGASGELAKLATEAGGILHALGSSLGFSADLSMQLADSSKDDTGQANATDHKTTTGTGSAVGNTAGTNRVTGDTSSRGASGGLKKLVSDGLTKTAALTKTEQHIEQLSSDQAVQDQQTVALSQIIPMEGSQAMLDAARAASVRLSREQVAPSADSTKQSIDTARADIDGNSLSKLNTLSAEYANKDSEFNDRYTAASTAIAHGNAALYATAAHQYAQDHNQDTAEFAALKSDFHRKYNLTEEGATLASSAMLAALNKADSGLDHNIMLAGGAGIAAAIGQGLANSKLSAAGKERAAGVAGEAATATVKDAAANKGLEHMGKKDVEAFLKKDFEQVAKRDLVAAAATSPDLLTGAGEVIDAGLMVDSVAEPLYDAYVLMQQSSHGGGHP